MGAYLEPGELAQGAILARAGVSPRRSAHAHPSWLGVSSERAWSCSTALNAASRSERIRL